MNGGGGQMNFLGKIIGDKTVFVIAECGVNHNGKLDVALKMIDVAKECGADAVKFQKRSLSHLYRPSVLAAPSDESHSLGVYIPILKECELSERDHRQLFNHCQRVGIKYLCSPWDLESVSFLESLGVEGYKVPSACLSDVYLAERIASTGKPSIFSTGMHCWDEVKKIVNRWLIPMFGTDKMALMHCVSSYPTANRDVNLGFLKIMADEFRGVQVGWSGHERGVPISVAAVAMGASIIERHFTLDRTWKGPDHAASLEPHGLEEMIRHIRAVQDALGAAKNINQGEVVARETLGKVLTWARNHAPGEQVSPASFVATSPGYGIPAYRGREMFEDGEQWVITKPVQVGRAVQVGDAIKIEQEVVHAQGS